MRPGDRVDAHMSVYRTIAPPLQPDPLQLSSGIIRFSERERFGYWFDHQYNLYRRVVTGDHLPLTLLKNPISTVISCGRSQQ